MSKFFKTFLLWLCVLSLPVQGMAGVARLACGTLHGDRMAAVAMLDHAAHPAQDDEGEVDEQAMLPCHPQVQTTTHAADKCSACAACCTGLGLVASVPQWPVTAQAPSILVATFTALLPSFLSDGLERPPRSISLA